MFENIHLNRHEMQEIQIRDVHRQNLFYEPGFFYKSTVPGRPVGIMSYRDISLARVMENPKRTRKYYKTSVFDDPSQRIPPLSGE
jgi:hypothetical protein